MHTRLRKRLIHVHPLVEDVPDVLDGGGDDAGAAGGADDEVEDACAQSQLGHHAATPHPLSLLIPSSELVGHGGARRTRSKRTKTAPKPSGGTIPGGAHFRRAKRTLRSLDNGRTDTTQRPLPGNNIVRRTRDIAKRVAGPRDGEVVHFVVHDDAGLGDHDETPKKGVDCGGEGDGHAGFVGDDDVRGAGLSQTRC